MVLVLPLGSLLLGVDWAGLPRTLAQRPVVQALRLSLWTSAVATLLCLVLGIPLAWWLADSATRGPLRRRVAGFVRTCVTLPLVLPPTVAGVALLTAFGRKGVVGHLLYQWSGLALPFTSVAVVLSQAFVAMPFLVVSLEGALAQRDQALEEAAWTMGADEWRTVRHVVLPMALPALAAGTVLCWARALGEFGATITFAGNLPGVTQTLPLAVYLAMQDDPAQARAMSVVLLVVAGVVIAGMRGRWVGGLGRIAGR
ncbi:MAG TPA: ABC transporter permease [Candidatus Luteococcus avicola]|nr:ABC transporter permease [Candidatus Luteococcus avicola]